MLSEKLTGPQLLKMFPEFYESWRFITAFTTAPIVSQIDEVHCPLRPLPKPLLEDHFNTVLPSTPGSSKWPPSIRFSYQNHVWTSSFPIRATYPAYFSLLYLIIRMVFGEELCSLLHSPVTSSLLGPNILLSTPFSKTLSLRSSLNVSSVHLSLYILG